ncbi:MAG: hypothetical protein AAF560_31000, partial [Acidobacteriota bacterium]
MRFPQRHSQRELHPSWLPKVAALTLTTLLSIQTASAQDDSDDAEPQATVDESIVVSANRVETPADEVGSSV